MHMYRHSQQLFCFKLDGRRAGREETEGIMYKQEILRFFCLQ